MIAGLFMRQKKSQFINTAANQRQEKHLKSLWPTDKRGKTAHDSRQNRPQAALVVRDE